ncbi:MAG: M28 family peptidase, partial [Actinobacteria bacterium]|nr:M28 family peptidase [Actinomycetota bacterium]
MVGAAVDERLERSVASVSQERLTAHIAQLARRSKHAGTPGELESLRFVEREIASYGYRTELILHEAYISLPGAARLVALDAEHRCITHSFSRPAAALEARLVDVGRGDDAGYAGRQVAGAAVLVDGIATPASTVAARLRGAVAQIHISPHEYLHEMCVSPVWGSPDDETVDELPATTVVTVELATGEELRHACAAGEVTVRLDAAVDTGWRRTPTLVADLPGPLGDDDEPFVLLSGHHDTWHLGVMDNGGANATMLEVARLCALERAHWRRGLRVAFWSGHSQGRYSSSAWYADNRWEELELRAVAHVNVDSTGGRGNTVVSDTTASAELHGLA